MQESEKNNPETMFTVSLAELINLIYPICYLALDAVLQSPKTLSGAIIKMRSYLIRQCPLSESHQNAPGPN